MPARPAVRPESAVAGGPAGSRGSCRAAVAAAWAGRRLGAGRGNPEPGVRAGWGLGMARCVGVAVPAGSVVGGGQYVSSRRVGPMRRARMRRLLHRHRPPIPPALLHHPLRHPSTRSDPPRQPCGPTTTRLTTAKLPAAPSDAPRVSRLLDSNRGGHARSALEAGPVFSVGGPDVVDRGTGRRRCTTTRMSAQAIRAAVAQRAAARIHNARAAAKSMSAATAHSVAATMKTGSAIPAQARRGANGPVPAGGRGPPES